MKRTENLGVVAGRSWCLTLVLLLLSAPSWAGSKYQVLHAFGKGNDGAGLWGSLAITGERRLYGTTSGGGAHDGGTVFELVPHADGVWSEIIVHDFPSWQKDGGSPTASVILDPLGNLYSTTQYGGGSYRYGTVFRLAPSSWKESILHSFSAQDGSIEPYAGVVRDKAGHLYGTLPHDGAVFELVQSANGWKDDTLYKFCSQPRCRDGDAPFAGVILDAAGNLYGTTEGGGAYNGGTVYEIERTAGGWKEKLLHSFAVNYKDGHTPGLGALVMDNSGALYGTTAGGGCCGGVIFKLAPGSGGSWKETILYEFEGGGLGFEAGAGVVMDKAGNLYGTTINGGSGGCGVVYKLAPTSSGKWKYTVLHAFHADNGCQPDANMILDDKGNLFGTTATGGAYIGGVVFELTP